MKPLLRLLLNFLVLSHAHDYYTHSRRKDPAMPPCDAPWSCLSGTTHPRLPCRVEWTERHYCPGASESLHNPKHSKKSSSRFRPTLMNIWQDLRELKFRQHLLSTCTSEEGRVDETVSHVLDKIQNLCEPPAGRRCSAKGCLSKTESDLFKAWYRLLAMAKHPSIGSVAMRLRASKEQILQELKYELLLSLSSP